MPPATGPSWTVTPLSRLSSPIALPRSYARRLSQVAPTLMPAGKTETRLHSVSKETTATHACLSLTNSVYLTPTGESCRHWPLMPRRGTPPVWPTHCSCCHPEPATVSGCRQVERQNQHTRSQVNFLFQSQLLDNFNGFLVRRFPVSSTAAPGTGVSRRRSLVRLGSSDGIGVGRDALWVGDIGELR